MALLDQLGLGGLVGGWSGSYYPQDYQWAMQQYIPQPYCSHQNCPICLENAKKIEEERLKIEELKTQKKLAYENHCKEYMEKFRRK